MISGAAFAALASLGGGASAQVCVPQNGYKLDVGTYLEVVNAGHDAFKSKKTVADCAVKEVEAALKGKPGTTTVFFGPMTQDECSLYRSLSAIDSKLKQGKLTDAYSTNEAMIAKVGSIQIDPGPQGKIIEAARVTSACITGAM